MSERIARGPLRRAKEAGCRAIGPDAGQCALLGALLADTGGLSPLSAKSARFRVLHMAALTMFLNALGRPV